MNTNSNVYTIIYSTILVVVVAAVLAFAASALKPMQDENIKKETITQVLSAAAQADESVTISEDVVAMYAEMAVDAFYVDGNGVVGEHMNIGKENKADIKVESTSYLKAQNDIIKKIEAGQTELLSTLALPVYVIKVNSLTVNVIPCYGAGLWGPIWGYIAVAEDGRTLDGAIFDHKSETPGLGAKIAEKPFYSQFKGKKFGEGEKIFDVVKGGANGAENGVDAISGATITSQSLGKTINTWAKYYQPYLNSLAAQTVTETEESAETEENAEVEDTTVTEEE